ncbi:MAG: plastocyanin/azurin family copper-binding protein [Actinomycetota bacterium]|nr:plastocyanin/azurin family copper-binding protein [Actinomycetota bacterium]
MKRIGMLAAAAVVAASVAGNGGAATPKLRAMVSDPVNISLTFGGKKVTTLKAGQYTIVVRDTAADHDFHLTGPGVNRRTTIGGTGTSRWNVTLQKGTYKYVCDPHSAFMKGSFTVK